MRYVVDGIGKVPHPEEAVKRPSRRTHGAHPADCQFFHTLESGNPGAARPQRVPPVQARGMLWTPAFALGYAQISELGRPAAYPPSPPLGAERVGVRWGSPRLRTAAPPTSPSPSLTRRGPSLSPRKRAERGKGSG